ncbi:sensor histidine kinase [Actinocorallia longicatena]|uniref:MEDS domain-containing protein n=1 Tax=Actinocorallia longicatena TaxID=111803 RepID=A0ABP6QBA1_9ACTN
MPMIGTGTELLVHREFGYDRDEDFLEAGALFLGTRVDAGETLVVISAADRFAALAERVPWPLQCLDAREWFDTPARTLSALVGLGREKWWPAGGVRVLAEPVWDGRSPAEIREWKRYEALINVVFAGTPTRMLCAYDRRTVSSGVLDAARRTHQGEHYTDPVRFSAECDRAPLAAPADPIASRGFRRGDLAALRDFTGREAAGLGLTRTFPLVLAVNEVATNIIKHGSGVGSLWVWSDGEQVVCDLIDHEFLLDDPFLGFVPPDPSRTGDAGMWAVRKLCDFVEIRTGSTGTLFRLRVRL